MNNVAEIAVPKQLLTKYFFGNSTTTVNLTKVKNINELLICSNFSYEVAYFTKFQCEPPWEKWEITIPQLIKSWELIELDLKHLFNNQNYDEIAKLMKLGTAVFIQTLFWLNEQPVTFQKSLPNTVNLKISLINLTDRLTFILEKLTFPHAFVQLQQLMIELNKKIAIKKSLIKD